MASIARLLMAAVLNVASALAGPLHAAPASSPPIVFAVSEAWSMPLAEFADADGRKSLVGGIAKAWQEALAQELGRTAAVLVLPRARMDVEAPLSADLRCFIAPEWTGETRVEYEWPTPFMHMEDRLVGSSAQALVQSLDDIPGRRIGTVFGYSYPALQRAFASKVLLRDDAPNEQAAQRKQIGGRVDYTVMRTLSLDYLRRTDPAARDLIASPLLLARTGVHCARPKKSTVAFEALQAAQDRLIRRGVLDRILADYRPLP